jgi:BASS family bile acid:Na+ symporter
MFALLKNRNFIFLAAIAFGLILPQAAIFSKHFMLLALAVVMTLATTSVPNDLFRSWRAFVMPSIAGIVISYLVLGGLLLALAAAFINDMDIWIGFVLIAAVPPAVAVIPFTAILKGDVPYTLTATVSAYLAALAVLPLMFFFFIGTEFTQKAKLIEVVLLLIVLPLLASRIILYLKLDEKIDSIRGLITDWGFFIVLYTMIGLNRDLIFSQPLMILPVALIIFAVIIVPGFLIKQTGLLFKIEKSRVTSLLLLGTLKNQGIAGGLAITLFAEKAALPSSLYTAFMILYFMWLDWLDLQQRRQKY